MSSEVPSGQGTVSKQPTDPVTFDDIYRVRAYTGPPRPDGASPIYCRPCGARVIGVWPVVFRDGRTFGCSKCRQPLVATLVPPQYGGLIGHQMRHPPRRGENGVGLASFAAPDSSRAGLAGFA